ncbi:mechanosensitive ion channel family protein [Anabaena sp. CCY 9402-a]|uniref:mechanosensitive ion channel family protein n=1 Tax=Anabaena sp. CCY 9402-a TaxID=3103867 RepID=UPI0039C5F741
MTEGWQTLQNLLSKPAVIKFIEVGIGIVIIALIFRILGKILPRQVQDTDLRYRIRKGISLAGYVIIGLVIISAFSNSIGRLTVIFGVVGAGVAFAMQEVIASFAGWVAISFGQFYKPGDRVKLGGIIGDVIDISILRTTLMECGDWVKADLYNGRIVRIANSFVFKEPVFNYSADFPFVWDEITIPVKYGSDRYLAREILQRVAEDVVGTYVSQAKGRWQNMVHKYLIEDARIEPTVTVAATDNWAEFTLRYVVDYKSRRGKKDQLFTQILDEFDNSLGRVTVASTTIQLVEVPSFDINIKNGK